MTTALFSAILILHRDMGMSCRTEGCYEAVHYIFVVIRVLIILILVITFQCLNFYLAYIGKAGLFGSDEPAPDKFIVVAAWIIWLLNLIASLAAIIFTVGWFTLCKVKGLSYAQERRIKTYVKVSIL